MSWQDRLDKHITLYSPSGSVFQAYWQGNKRSMDKKLGVFEIPRAQGAIVQDLDVGPVKYPLTIFFEGENHDINADRFFTACKERGPWAVIHPVRGELKLQLVSVTEEIQPVTSGNVTEFNLEWIEPGLKRPVASTSMLAAKIYAMKAEIEENQSAVPVNIEKPSLLARVLAFIAKLQGIYATATGHYQTVAGIINTAVTTATSLIGAATDLVSLPAAMTKDLKARFRYYGKILDASWKDLTTAINELDGLAGDQLAAVRNNVAITEVVFTATLMGMAQSVVEGDFKSREEALRYLDAFNDAFMTGVTNLDRAQAAFSTAPVDQQYFSLAGTYGDMTALVQLVGDLILHRAFDLGAVKYITLQRDRAPVEIAVTEGVDLDTLIAANQLSGTEILLLPAGRRVAVYL